MFRFNGFIVREVLNGDLTYFETRTKKIIRDESISNLLCRTAVKNLKNRFRIVLNNVRRAVPD